MTAKQLELWEASGDGKVYQRGDGVWVAELFGWYIAHGTTKEAAVKAVINSAEKEAQGLW